jgi:TrmH family RNA methyltransferase
MLSKNKIKFIQSLNHKKARSHENVFLVEGNKMVMEAVLSRAPIQMIAATPAFYSENNIHEKAAIELVECSADELKKASLLQNPQEALAVVNMQSWNISAAEIKDELTLALDFVQDPGNLGTIIRIADWFGIRNIVCSNDTADCYNPKVVQASMGAIFRVKVHYLDLAVFLGEASQNKVPVYGTFLEGENIYKSKLSATGILVMGNEGNGISPETEKLIQHKIHIPSFSVGETGSESLNVATATAICCSEFRRRLDNIG